MVQNEQREKQKKGASRMKFYTAANLTETLFTCDKVDFEGTPIFFSPSNKNKLRKLEDGRIPSGSSGHRR